jgi:Rrf2 family transcriptional regulator, nitric oxide-sensitive transcriptional repressor
MFSQTTEYALRAMACLALTPGELVPTSIIASKTKVPSNYLAKVLQQLGDSGLISGRRGVRGGYRLARTPAEVSMLEIVRAVTTLDRIETCPLGLVTHGPNLCPLHRAMDRAAATVMAMFEGVTLQHLVSDPVNPGRPLCEAGAAASLTISGRARR